MPYTLEDFYVMFNQTATVAEKIELLKKWSTLRTSFELDWEGLIRQWSNVKVQGMLLSYNELVGLTRDGVVQNSRPGAVNATSIDIHLGDTILWESNRTPIATIVDYRSREPVKFQEHVMDAEDGWILEPGDFILAQSVEVFNLPDYISGEYKLKSSMARIGLEHMNAGWCDAGWSGSVLTLELKNMCNHHAIKIRPGDPIGQMVFFKHELVPEHASYFNRGRYNGDTIVMGIKP